MEARTGDQKLILVDGQDRVIGFAPRDRCHRRWGHRHRAIAVLLFDDQGRALLQQRRAELWDGMWDLTGATHPLHLPEGDETYEAAADRCMRDEWSVVADLQPVLAFDYFARHGESCENEHCVLFVGRALGEPRLNPFHGYAMRWTDWSTCRDEIGQADRFTPWARLAVERLDEHPALRQLLPEHAAART